MKSFTSRQAIMADIGPTDMTAVSTLQMLALHRRQEAGSAQEAADGISHENLAGLLERDLQGSRRFKTLRGLLDLLCDDGKRRRMGAGACPPLDIPLVPGTWHLVYAG